MKENIKTFLMALMFGLTLFLMAGLVHAEDTAGAQGNGKGSSLDVRLSNL